VTLAAVNLVALEIPQLIKSIVDTLTAGGDVSATTDTALLIIGMGFLMLIIRALSRLLLFWPGRKIEASIKFDLFSKILRLPYQGLLKFGMGDIISRLANDVGQLRALYAFGLLQAINMFFLLIMAIGKMLSVHLTLTVVCLLPLTLMFLVSRYAMPKMHTYSKIQQEALGRLTNKVTESFVNVHVIQANGAEETFFRSAQEVNEEVYQSNVKLVLIRTTLFLLMPMLAAMSQLTILLYGGFEVIAGKITVGDIMAFNVYIGLLMFPLTAMGFLMAMLQRARTAIERIVEVEDETEETFQPPGEGIDTDALLTIDHLTFKYKDSESHKQPFSLKDISFTLRPGQRIGIFGPIGSGKSTLFNAITRILDPEPGQIFWRGKDTSQISPPELRRQIGYAMQSVHLFSDTIEANLGFGLDAPTKEELIEAARQAQILDEIESFERGWNTEIGERGVRLSGGQKQRLALARIFLRKPPLLILDDVLSAVDQSTEKALIESMFKLGGAVLIASHRASALKECEEILILQEGTIVARGTFDSLARRFPDLNQEQ
jgi:ATP-binding cassette subfamily B protein